MATCRISFTLVCLIAIAGGISIIALQIVSASTKAWVFVGVVRTTFAFGLFTVQDTVALMTLTLVRNTALVTMQAMLIFSTGIGSSAIIFTILGITQRPICGRGTQFYIRLAEILFALSAALYLVGLSVFSHSWITHPSSFFRPTLRSGATFNYGYAYMVAWFTFLLQVALTTFVICAMNINIREHDRQLAAPDERSNEKQKLIAGHSKGGDQDSTGASSSKSAVTTTPELAKTSKKTADAEKQGNIGAETGTTETPTEASSVPTIGREKPID